MWSHWLHIRPLAFFIHRSHETPSHSQPISLWCIWWSIHTIIFYTHSNCIFLFFLVASQLCKWCDCMLLLPRLINECTWKFAKILLWSTRGLPWTVSSSVKISVFIIFIFISGTVFSACLEVGFRRFLFLSESNGQTQIVTQILYLHDWSTTLIRFSWLLRKAARVASFAVIVFEFFCFF